jgi:hypothetical protein
MGSLVPLARATQVVPRPKLALSTTHRQLDLVLDDVRLHGMTAAQRQAALKALARLLLEASGAVTTEVGDDDA